MTTPSTDNLERRSLTPDDIRHVDLPVVPHNGYDALTARHWLVAAGDELAIAHTEIKKLKADLVACKQSATPDINAETVNLLSRAQIIADKHISDAELYAYDLIDSARKQYTEILQKAQTHVASANAAPAAAQKDSQTTEAKATPQANAPAPASSIEYSSPIPQVEYVRTYTKVVQVQLRAVIDALVEQIDQLGEVPGSALQVPAQVSK
ncbi:hypothetical protein CQ018_18150 [Arthrobacter sp. MYb227]|uniref:hypothetical protein n=1 Tax=Arthrobacter sp. MYb227 TaxID=1848601 RepID=UPI000CFDEA70|nr:hypothetical protein [Arthrobacter sp. MYb227]PQZ86961.1 hypothetical protein CQ018_18150 [Arthrobacter sp. MYb227]